MSFFIDLVPTPGWDAIMDQSLTPMMRSALANYRPVDPVVQWQAEMERAGRIIPYYGGKTTRTDYDPLGQEYVDEESADEEEIDTEDGEVDNNTIIIDRTTKNNSTYNTYNTYNYYTETTGNEKEEDDDYQKQQYIYLPSKEKDSGGTDMMPFLFILMMLMNTGVAGQTLMQRNTM